MTEISIIIPTRNNRNSLPRLLESIKRQTVAPREVLVVDGSSDDDTAEVARHAQVTLLSYECTGDQRGFARNLGAKAAKGDALFFIDSDMELDRSLIQECSRLLEAGSDCLVIPERTLGRGFLGRLRDWERRAVQSTSLLVFARVIRKGLFWQAGGFDELILGFEDLDLQMALLELHSEMRRTEAAINHHEEGQNALSYLGKRIYYQRSSKRVRDKHPELAKAVFNPYERMKLYGRNVRTPAELLMLSAAICMRGIEILPGSFGFGA